MTIPSYGERAYWEQRYAETKGETFEWYGGWKTVKHFFQKLELKKDISILHVGCGNSAIAEEMHDYGYRHSYCIDFVDNVIAEMKKRSQESCPEIKYDVMDITDSAFVSHVDSNFRFQVVLDKGCLDTVVCGTSVNDNVSTMLNNVWECLTTNGHYIILSYGAPEDRLSLLEEGNRFTVKVMVFKKHSLKDALEGCEYDLDIQDYKEGKHYENSYFVYICQKVGS